MKERAYNELLLNNSKNNLAVLFDYAVNIKHLSIDRIVDDFLSSDISKQIERGSSIYIDGRTGIELYFEIEDDNLIEEYYCYDRSKEFWLGYYVAYAQWYIGCSFRDIFKVIPPNDLLERYSIYHEVSEIKFAEFIKELLKTFRKN